jgi:hypothetical protein
MADVVDVESVDLVVRRIVELQLTLGRVARIGYTGAGKVSYTRQLGLGCHIRARGFDADFGGEFACNGFLNCADLGINTKIFRLAIRCLGHGYDQIFWFGHGS